MAENEVRSDEKDFYFEDDSEYDGYQGCGMSIPPVFDPITLLNPDRLSKFQYNGEWKKYDFLKVESQQDDYRPGIAYINDNRVPIHRRTDMYEYTYSMSDIPSQRKHLLPYIKEFCPYCKNKLSTHQIEDGESKWDNEDDFVEEMDEYAKIYALEYCNNCRYWRWHDLDVFKSFDEVSHSYKGFLSKIKEFNGNLPTGFSAEFAQWIRRNEYRWHTMQPKSLERLVADIIKSVYQSSEVVHVGKPGDGGVDVIFIESDNKKWLVQVKRREKAKCSEPIETIRNLLGTMILESSSYGMIVSTADHFTYCAYDACSRASEKGMFIKLIDRGKLNKMLDSVLPEKPWLDVITAQYPTIVSEFDKE